MRGDFVRLSTVDGVLVRANVHFTLACNSRRPTNDCCQPVPRAVKNVHESDIMCTVHRCGEERWASFSLMYRCERGRVSETWGASEQWNCETNVYIHYTADSAAFYLQLFIIHFSQLLSVVCVKNLLFIWRTNQRNQRTCGVVTTVTSRFLVDWTLNSNFINGLNAINNFFGQFWCFCHSSNHFFFTRELVMQITIVRLKRQAKNFEPRVFRCHFYRMTRSSFLSRDNLLILTFFFSLSFFFDLVPDLL